MHAALAVVLWLLMLPGNISAQGLPCDCAQRWVEGAHWNLNGTVNDAPNAPQKKGIIRCGNSADTQSQINPKTGCSYDSNAFPVNLPANSCFNPSNGQTIPLVQNPTNGQPIIWLNFDVRAFASSFSFQLNDNSGDNIGWALYASAQPTTGVNWVASAGDSLSGSCAASDMILVEWGDESGRIWCGSESASTWSTPNAEGTIGIDFTSANNFYMLIWDQSADGNLQVNNFKARYGCGDDVTICALELADEETVVCNPDGGFTVTVPVYGNNGEFRGFDVNAVPQFSDAICFTNPAATPSVISGTITMTYPAGVMGYNITISAQSPPDGACADPANAADCMEIVSGSAPASADATAAGGTIDCNDSSVQLNGSSSTAGAMFSWTGPEGFTSLDEDPIVTAPGIYVLTVSTTAGCSATAEAEVGLDTDAPGATATGGTITCSEECVMLMGSSMTEGVTYAWSGPDGFTSDAQNVEVCVAGTYTLTVTAANGCTSTDTAEIGMDNSVPDVSAEGGTITCSEECVMLMGSSMTEGVTYAWSGPDGFTSDAQNVEVCVAGTYTLTVTATNGCSGSDMAVVSMDTDAPLVDVEGGEITCSMECVTLTASSTTEGVSYSWSGSGISLDGAELEVCAPGVYTVVVVGPNGCSAEGTAVVTEAEDLSIDVTGECESKNGGTATVTVLTGGGQYEFMWSTNETTSSIGGLGSGTYSVTVTDLNGCTAMGEVTLDCPEECELTMVVETGCVAEDNGWASVDQILNANGNTTILWSTGETTSYVDGLAFGEHWVMVTDENGCTDKQTFSIDCKKECELEIVVEYGCLGEENGWASVDQVLNGTAPVTILWSTGQSDSFISGLADGAHWVMVTDADECWVKYDFNIACEKDCELQADLSTDCVDGVGSASLMVSGADEYSILWSTWETTASISGLANGEYWYMVSAGKDCSVKVEFTIDCDQPEDCSFRTQTQGGWGAPPNGDNNGVYLHANFAAAFPEGLQIGCTNTLKLTSAQAVTDYLPAGGPPAMLPAGMMVDPVNYGNVLAAQLVTAKLNVGFDAYDPTFGESSTLLADAYLTSGMFAGWTVGQVIMAADDRIGGCPSLYSPSQLNAALSAINENYVDATTDNGFISCMPVIVGTPATPAKPVKDPSVFNAKPSKKNLQTGSANSTIEVYPNPAREVLNVHVIAGDAGNITMEMLDMSGRTVLNIISYQAEIGDDRRMSIDLNILPEGVYLLNVQQNDVRELKRIVITR